jgi:hypothetical protein
MMKAILALALALPLSAHAASVTTWTVTPADNETISEPVLSGGSLTFKVTAPTEGGGGGIIAANTILPPSGTMVVGADTWAFGKAVGDGRYVILRNTADTMGKGELVKTVKSEVYTRAGVNWYKWFGGTTWGWIGSTEP